MQNGTDCRRTGCGCCVCRRGRSDSSGERVALLSTLLWPFPVVRCRAADERSVYGQGLSRVRGDGWNPARKRRHYELRRVSANKEKQQFFWQTGPSPKLHNRALVKSSARVKHGFSSLDNAKSRSASHISETLARPVPSGRQDQKHSAAGARHRERRHLSHPRSIALGVARRSRKVSAVRSSDGGRQQRGDDALGAKALSSMVEGEKRFDISVRWPRRLGSSEVDILDIPVDIINNRPAS